MRLYSLVGADSHVDPGYGRFTPDEAGGFDFPDEVSDLIGGFAVKGKRLWETEESRADRLHGMEMARRRDPASMLAAMEDNAALTRRVTELMAMLTEAQLGKAAAPLPASLAEELAPEAPAAPEGDSKGGHASDQAPVKGSRTSKAAPVKPGPAAA